MNSKCLLGLHTWDGCKCSVCGKTRDEGHDWSKDCETCDRCGKVRTNAHTWDGCKCSVCGKLCNERLDSLIEKLLYMSEHEYSCSDEQREIQKTLVSMGSIVLDELFKHLYGEWKFTRKYTLKAMIELIGVKDVGYLLKKLEQQPKPDDGYCSEILKLISLRPEGDKQQAALWLTQAGNRRHIHNLEHVCAASGADAVKVLGCFLHDQSDSMDNNVIAAIERNKQKAAEELAELGEPAKDLVLGFIRDPGVSDFDKDSVAEKFADHECSITPLVELFLSSNEKMRKLAIRALGFTFNSHKKLLFDYLMSKIAEGTEGYDELMSTLIRKSSQKNAWAELLIHYLATGDVRQKGKVIDLLKAIGYGRLHVNQRRAIDAYFEPGINPFHNISEVLEEMLKYINIINSNASSERKEMALNVIAECGGRESIEPVLGLFSGPWPCSITWKAATTLNALLERTGEHINNGKLNGLLFMMAGESISDATKKKIVKELAHHLGLTWLEQAMSPDAESEVINKLQEVGDDACQDILIAVINRNYVGPPTLLAMDALAALGSKKCTLTLLQRLGSRSCDARLAAVKALTRLGDTRWQPMVQGEDEDLNRLGNSGYTEAADALMYALEYSVLEVSVLPFKYLAIANMERLAQGGQRREDILGSLARVFLAHQFDNWSELARAAATAQYNIAGIRL